MSKRPSSSQGGDGGKHARTDDAEEMIAGGDGAGGGAGAAGSSGDMSPVNFNNGYSGTVVFQIADVMAGPASITYEQVWLGAKAQHPICEHLPDNVNPAAPTDIISMTVLTVDLYGCSAGGLTFCPYVQRPAVTYEYQPLTLAVDQKYEVLGQQLFDVGTISRKPHLFHNYGNSINNTRAVNILQTATQLNYNRDILFQYQQTQFAATPIPVDVGYMRITFMIRFTDHFVPLAAVTTPPVPALKRETVKQLRTRQQKRIDELVKMKQLDRIKMLTCSTLDNK